ncbi:hypoxanthine phosphoribosyltransferase [Phragmitibacter flavus]|uniref:Hypoxanthine phosphoribosyltransferase n=1 Tax=Phragmitibacter flavus TaxID=2576071 RepID=A0A5R8KES1_9BACT|nr:hypoxanthine phosphoribosyltransferase [Phragmitibacter flavus]TLD70757.1 hypoxanthine phosphoribosyltransferase [Phragmitibacter flavus]
MNHSTAGVLSDLEQVLIDPVQIQLRVTQLAHQIHRDFEGRNLSVVALMDGSLFFVADLLRHMDIPIQLHTLTVSSYHGGTTSSGRLQLAQQLPFALKTPHVLLIDDILDTGLTLASVRDRLIEEFQPEKLRTVVLLNKEARRKADIHADYVGFEIEDQFVVGYGMDYQGHYRNLPCIGILNPDNLK